MVDRRKRPHEALEHSIGIPSTSALEPRLSSAQQHRETNGSRGGGDPNGEDKRPQAHTLGVVPPRADPLTSSSSALAGGAANRSEFIRIRWDPREMGQPPTDTLRRLLRGASDSPDGSKGLVFRRLETRSDDEGKTAVGPTPASCGKPDDASPHPPTHADRIATETQTRTTPATTTADGIPTSTTSTTVHLQRLGCRDSVVVLDCSTGAGAGDAIRHRSSPPLRPSPLLQQSSGERETDNENRKSSPSMSHFVGKDIFVLDEAATQHALTHSMEQAMTSVQLSPSVKHTSAIPAASPSLRLKRERANDAENRGPQDSLGTSGDDTYNWSAIPEYFLRPVPRLESFASPSASAAALTTCMGLKQWNTVGRGGHGEMRMMMMDSLEAARQRLVASAYSYWEQVTGDIVDEALTELSLAYASQFELPPETEEEAKETYLRGIYCYPDHRQDDEYDSNAEDFEGNEYPDEKSSEDEMADDEEGLQAIGEDEMADDEEEGECEEDDDDDFARFHLGDNDDDEEEEEEKGGGGAAKFRDWVYGSPPVSTTGYRRGRQRAYDGWEDKNGYDDNEYEDMVWGSENDNEDDW